MNGDVNYVKSSPAFEIRLPARRTLVGLKRLRTTYTSTCEMVHYLLLFSLWPTSNNESRTHSTGKAGGDMIKIVDTFWALYHVRWCLRMPENQILSLKPNVPFLPYWPYWKISDLFEFYTRNTSFLTFPIQGTFGLGLKIWFSGILRHHLTWYKAQKVSTILIMSPPAFSVECERPL